MKREPKPYTQANLAMQVMAGGYLLYTVWKLRDAIAESPLFIIAIVVFAVLGAYLLIRGGWKLIRGEFVGGSREAHPESEEQTQDEEEPA